MTTAEWIPPTFYKHTLTIFEQGAIWDWSLKQEMRRFRASSLRKWQSSGDAEVPYGIRLYDTPGDKSYSGGQEADLKPRGKSREALQK